MIDRKQAEFVATNLLGWERCDVQPGEQGFEHVETPLEAWKLPDGSRSYGSGTLYQFSEWSGAGMIIEAMITRNMLPSINSYPGHWWVHFSLGNSERGKTLPVAVLKAAYSALSSQSNGNE